MLQVRSLLLLLAASAFAPPASAVSLHAATSVGQASHYPQRRSELVVRFFGVATDSPEAEAATAELAQLGASIAYGPRASVTRKGSTFFALRAPASASSKDLAMALRKAGGAVRELECVVFDGHGPFDKGPDGRDELLDMFESVVWIDTAGPRTQMYLEKAPSAKEAEAMIERYAMMCEQNSYLGRLSRDTFIWTLAAAPDAKAAKRIRKSILQLDGVVGATLEGSELTVEVELLALAISGDSGSLARDERLGGETDPAGRTAPRASWPTLALHDLLAAESLLVRAEDAK